MTLKDDFSQTMKRFHQPTLRQLVEELRDHIPQDEDTEEDFLLLQDHGDRYRRFRKQQT